MSPIGPLSLALPPPGGTPRRRESTLPGSPDRQARQVTGAPVAERVAAASAESRGPAAGTPLAGGSRPGAATDPAAAIRVFRTVESMSGAPGGPRLLDIRV